MTDSFEESVALREQIPHEGLALMSALVERDMDHNFRMMDSLYESEKRRADALQQEVYRLRADAERWRAFVAMVQDTMSPWEG